MPARNQTLTAFLIRDERGRMRTVQAYTHRGAIKNAKSLKPGVYDVKKRLGGGWHSYRVS